LSCRTHQLFAEGVVARDDVFITGKLNNPYHHPEHVRPHVLKTLLDLNVKQLDLLLMHWPVAFVFVPYDGTR
jgi:diketogulonate reductase-like aldo/keto reductase